jgi:hypothetical protein
MIARKKVRIAALTGSAVVVVLVIAWLYRPAESLDKAAVRIASCLSSKDASCISSYVSDGEKSAVLTGSEDINAVVSYLLSPLPSASYEATPSSPGRETDGLDYYTVSGRSQDGRFVEVAIRIAYTPDGVKAPELLSELTKVGWFLQGDSIPAETNGLAKLLRIRSGAQRTIGRLKELGMVGVMRRGEVQTWEQLTAYYDDAVARASAQ